MWQGQPPRDPDAPALILHGTRQEVVGDMLALSKMITIFEEADCRIQEMEASFRWVGWEPVSAVAVAQLERPSAETHFEAVGRRLQPIPRPALALFVSQSPSLPGWLSAARPHM
jgi:hypothetical protein